MTILRKIENPSGDNTGFVEKIQHENNVEANGVATSNYNDLKDKPLINGVILQGRLSLDDLYIQEKGDYAKADEIPTKVSELENDKGYVTEVPTKISELENDKNYITEYTETDPTIPQYIKNIKEEDIASWNAKSEFSGNYDDLNNKPAIPSIAGLATEEYVNNAISKIPSTDLTGYATLDDVDDAITEIVGAAPETLDTLAELAEGLVANKNVVEVLNDAMVDKVNRTELHAVAISGSYNDLINQPEGLATEQYVDDALGNVDSTYYWDGEYAGNEEMLQEVYDKIVAGEHVVVKCSKAFDADAITGNGHTICDNYPVFVGAHYKSTTGPTPGHNYCLESIITHSNGDTNKELSLLSTKVRFTVTDDVVTGIKIINNSYYAPRGSALATAYNQMNNGAWYNRTLTVDNTYSFTPTKDYHPATKKYVDDQVGDINTILATLTTVEEVSE